MQISSPSIELTDRVNGRAVVSIEASVPAIFCGQTLSKKKILVRTPRGVFTRNTVSSDEKR